ncbi:MAG: hypothetical protein JSS67_08450 [Bacteroidetes bacterium]|nr:hypothetical protein [Bacteroidota bacterium]
MAILKFRIYLEEDDTVYRDILIQHKQYFSQLHGTILQAFGFDNKHEATFFRSNDQWVHGREISLMKYDKPYKAEPLLMDQTTIGSEILDTNQKFIYLYDFTKKWTFLIELIHVTKEENRNMTYPYISRSEGIGPTQYGTKSLLGSKFADIEEKYDLGKNLDGFSEEGEDGLNTGNMDISEDADE